MSHFKRFCISSITGRASPALEYFEYFIVYCDTAHGNKWSQVSAQQWEKADSRIVYEKSRRNQLYNFYLKHHSKLLMEKLGWCESSDTMHWLMSGSSIDLRSSTISLERSRECPIISMLRKVQAKEGFFFTTHCIWHNLLINSSYFVIAAEQNDMELILTS